MDARNIKESTPKEKPTPKVIQILSGYGASGGIFINYFSGFPGFNFFLKSDQTQDSLKKRLL